MVHYTRIGAKKATRNHPLLFCLLDVAYKKTSKTRGIIPPELPSTLSSK